MRAQITLHRAALPRGHPARINSRLSAAVAFALDGQLDEAVGIVNTAQPAAYLDWDKGRRPWKHLICVVAICKGFMTLSSWLGSNPRCDGCNAQDPFPHPRARALAVSSFAYDVGAVVRVLQGALCASCCQRIIEEEQSMVEAGGRGPVPLCSVPSATVGTDRLGALGSNHCTSSVTGSIHRFMPLALTDCQWPSSSSTQLAARLSCMVNKCTY
eukprot:1162087-Pelagomonas_calceolata.AAC.13